MTPLPRLMVAPNGARRGKADHARLPVTDAEVVAAVVASAAAGADGAHVHIRDEDGKHQIDAGHYRALVDQLRDAVPDMYLQVTSESADRYSGAEQRLMMRELVPQHVSVGMREMVRQPSDWPEAQDFYEWAQDAKVDVQHILYSPQEVRTFWESVDAGRIPGTHHLIQLVQGTYANGAKGKAALADYLAEMSAGAGQTYDWMLCAFGAEETDSLVDAALAGGKARVGFENSLWNKDGSLAADNAMRVREVDAAIRAATGA
ncbi:MAG: 3-keto-5-aminohexanoate cleavage protein [Yoonia sp.]|uniref:3-keto-5-aminohexanoate cleavage protein n=1 Tax=Yoonia sp. TaxID=2212373 RepID=UPI003EF63135